MLTLKLTDFDFTLPESLIAQYPLPKRSSSRLLYLCASRLPEQQISHHYFYDLPSLLQPQDLLVFNDTKVIKARLFGKKESGGNVEIFIERIIDDNSAIAQVRANKKIKIGMPIILVDEHRATVVDKQQEFFLLKFSSPLSVSAILQKYGHTPLPPYITRIDDSMDEKRYQSIFAKQDGAVAAPTASLHFDEGVIAALKAKNIDLAFVTLHVGAGTFQPVRVEEVTQHKMHAEYMEINEDVCAKINETKARGGRIIAVGTTCVRCLETAAQLGGGKIIPFCGDTDIFIYPGFEFKCVDGIITNFHLPKSTLLMLICAFAGYDNVMSAYKEAVNMQYRFFSYGDAMLLVK